MANEMVERVQIILANQGESSDYYALARKVIAAMREPTEEMTDAGAYDLDITIKSQYMNMIDAALKE